ncbi:transcriptional regulator [Actinomycetes bacterium KLBMP 9797]
MAHPSSTELLVLHAVRLKGHADTGAVAARFGLDPQDTHEHLLDAQAYGWVTRSSFADLTGWSLTSAGRQRNADQLRDELDGVAARAAVAAVHEEFLPVNAEAARVFTAWQLGQVPAHGDVHEQLGGIAAGLGRLEPRLTAHLARFAGYHDRFTGALDRAAGDPVWITGMEVDSCHRVWFELHEDLVATLDVPR